MDCVKRLRCFFDEYILLIDWLNTDVSGYCLRTLRDLENEV